VNLLLFPVDEPQHFDSVVSDEFGYVQRVDVKRADFDSHWVWGAVTATGNAFRELKLLWESRHRQDEYLGDLLNATIAAGNTVRGSAVGELYMDVGTLGGYRAAQQYLEQRERQLTRVA
jgi:glucose-1-phosphate thymidylyltransferase